MSDDSDKHDAGRRPAVRVEDGVTLSRPILHCANRGPGGLEFLRESSQVLLDFSDCDAIEVRVNDRALHDRWEAALRPENVAGFELVHWISGEDGTVKRAMFGKHPQPNPSDVKIPIILTGDMRPYEFRGTDDAVQNVTDALVACALLDPGAWVAMYNRALRSPKVAKDRDRMTFVQRDE